MHPDRTPTSGVGVRRPCPSARPDRRPCRPRVVGLGAPISVQIRLCACQLPQLRVAVQRLLEDARRCASEDVSADDSAVVRAWEAMLDQLADPGLDDDEIEVLWPTVL